MVKYEKIIVYNLHRSKMVFLSYSTLMNKIPFFSAILCESFLYFTI